MSSPYQPAPDGVWRSSPERILLWALTGAMHRIEREIPEQKHVTRWESRLAKAIADPVVKYDWTKLWTAKHLRKDDEGPEPPDIDFGAIPGLIEGADGLWMDAAETRAQGLNLPFDPADMQAGFDAAADMVKSIPDTLHDRLRTIMREAYDEASGPQGFARKIRDEFRDLSKSKAEQIAKTEWNRAASTATIEGYRKQGVESKVWITLGDNRVCEMCENNSADGEIPIGTAFFSGDDAPPAHPGCRCSISSA